MANAPAPSRATPRVAKLSPDRLAALEEERDFLLRSLADLDAEYAAGDIDDTDYRELKDDYTVRAAGAIRAIEDHQLAWEQAMANRQGSPWRRWAWVAGVIAGAMVAGLILARTVGERGVNDGLTGSVEESLRERVLQCQAMATQGAEGLAESLSCFAEVLDEDPNNTEALTYRGWYISLVAASAQDQALQEQADELYDSAVTSIDKAIAIDPSYPDARVFRAVIADRQGDEARACAELEVLDTLNAPVMMDQLTESLRERLSCS